MSGLVTTTFPPSVFAADILINILGPSSQLHSTSHRSRLVSNQFAPPKDGELRSGSEGKQVSNMCKKWLYALNDKLDSWPWVSPMWLNNLSHTKPFPLHRVLFELYLQSSSFLALLHLIAEQHVLTFTTLNHIPTCNTSSCDDVDARFLLDMVKNPKTRTWLF